MAAIFKPVDANPYVIGRGQMIFVPTAEHVTTRRRRRRLRGKRKAGLLPPLRMPFGDVDNVVIRFSESMERRIAQLPRGQSAIRGE